MGALTKMHIRYEIKTPFPMYVEPGSRVEGRVIVKNEGDKDKKLKELYVELYEVYEEKYTDDTGENFKQVKNSYGRFHLQTRGTIQAHEEQAYEFSIILPRWKITKGRKIYTWRMEFHFNQKTKLVASRGSIPQNATCVLPVEGTTVVPSFGDSGLVQLKKKKKKRR